jgi:hypothetical protein
MKKIAIFGASGMTGICALEAALNSGEFFKKPLALIAN